MLGCCVLCAVGETLPRCRVVSSAILPATLNSLCERSELSASAASSEERSDEPCAERIERGRRSESAAGADAQRGGNRAELTERSDPQHKEAQREARTSADGRTNPKREGAATRHAGTDAAGQAGTRERGAASRPRQHQRASPAERTRL